MSKVLVRVVEGKCQGGYHKIGDTFEIDYAEKILNISKGEKKEIVFTGLFYFRGTFSNGNNSDFEPDCLFITANATFNASKFSVFQVHQSNFRS